MTMQGSYLPLRLTGTLAPTTVILAAATNSEEFDTTQLQSVRIRVKVSAAATLKVFGLLADGTTSSLAGAPGGNPADVVLVANTENLMEVPLKGEAAIRISILAGGGNSTVTYVDVYPLRNK